MNIYIYEIDNDGYIVANIFGIKRKIINKGISNNEKENLGLSIKGTLHFINNLSSKDSLDPSE